MRKIASYGATVLNEFTEGNPSTNTPATVLSADWLNIVQTELVGVVEAAGLTVDQSHGFGEATPNNTGQLLLAIQNLVASGGGGGGGFQWKLIGGNAPVEVESNNETVMAFDPLLAQELYATVKVPSGYQAGKACKMYMAFFSPSTSNGVLFKAQSTLIRKAVDAFSSTTNQRTTTNLILTNTVANQYREVELDLTDSTGHINSVAIGAGDLIKVRLYRDTDTDTGTVNMIASATQVTFG